MSRRSKCEYFTVMYERYHKASAPEKGKLLDELCRVCGYHRKHAIRKLNRPLRDAKPHAVSPRGRIYGSQVVSILKAVWEAAGYPWSVRLKALLPIWLPWIHLHFRLSPAVEFQLLRISPRQIDRRLGKYKRQVRRRIYGRTKPGSLLKHQIAIRTTHWDVLEPGYAEVDLVAHSGHSASGTFIYSLNLTDIYTGWVETRAVMGKGERGVLAALAEIQRELPFELKGIDSDNGGEFINAHLVRYCDQHGIEFTRGRPYKKDDNAHIEQKNWTHVRKVLGWERYASPRALAALNKFYRGSWGLMMNLFQPSIKLRQKVRKGSRLVRQYDTPQTPFYRLCQSKQGRAAAIVALEYLLMRTDPFQLAKRIDQQLDTIWSLADPRHSPGRQVG